MKKVICLLFLFFSYDAFAARIKDIASIRGVRHNQLVGYGLVVGLKGTGDGGLQFTNQSMKRMLDKLGVKLGEEAVESANIAAVVVTAKLPPFAKSGNPLSVTVNSIGDLHKELYPFGSSFLVNLAPKFGNAKILGLAPWQYLGILLLLIFLLLIKSMDILRNNYEVLIYNYSFMIILNHQVSFDVTMDI